MTPQDELLDVGIGLVGSATLGVGTCNVHTCTFWQWPSLVLFPDLTNPSANHFQYCARGSRVRWLLSCFLVWISRVNIQRHLDLTQGLACWFSRIWSPAVFSTLCSSSNLTVYQ